MRKQFFLSILLCCALLPANVQAEARITSEMLVFHDAVYACYTGADLGGTVKKMSAKARFFGGGACALIATSNYPDSVGSITARAIHVVFDARGYFLGFCEDGTVTDVKTGEYTLDLTGEKEYSFGWSISGDTITLTLPTGKTVKYKNDRVKEYGGRYAVWEHYLTPEDRLLGTGPAFTSISGTGETSLQDDFARPDGALDSAPTGQAYICFAN